MLYSWAFCLVPNAKTYKNFLLSGLGNLHSQDWIHDRNKRKFSMDSDSAHL